MLCSIRRHHPAARAVRRSDGERWPCPGPASRRSHGRARCQARAVATPAASPQQSQAGAGGRARQQFGRESRSWTLINGCEEQKPGSAEAESWRLPEPASLPKSASNTTVPQPTRGHGGERHRHGPASSPVKPASCCCSWNFPNQPWLSSRKLSRAGSAPPRHQKRLHL